MRFDLLHPRDQIERVMARIYDREMTTTSGGNISIRDGDEVWMTPARVDKGRLTRADMARVGLDGSVLGGAHKPSSECPFHLGIYKARPDIGAIIHAHPGALVSFSICGQVPDTAVFPEARARCGEVAFAPYALPGSEQLGENIASQFANSASTFCVVLENHGVVVGGRDLDDAFKRFETLEFTARMLLRARQLGEARRIDDPQLALYLDRGNALPALATEAPSNRERELRKDIRDFVRRAYHHGLMTSTWGSLSTRLGDDHFLITPYGVDRANLEIEDPVVVRSGQCPEGTRPSRAVDLHRAIYQAHPEVEAIVNALPVSASAFSISEEALDSRTIPESYLFLRDVPVIGFAELMPDPAGAASKVGPDHPVALLRHNGALVAGKSVLDAFDRLEVLEATAAAILDSRPLGPVNAMSDAVIDELDQAFGRV